LLQQKIMNNRKKKSRIAKTIESELTPQ